MEFFFNVLLTTECQEHLLHCVSLKYQLYSCMFKYQLINPGLSLFSGHKAGYLGSAYFAGNFFASPVWGWASDKVGRKPTLLLGICGIIGSELLFGFSQNFGWAIAARFLWGLLNGNLGVAKTYISEVIQTCVWSNCNLYMMSLFLDL